MTSTFKKSIWLGALCAMLAVVALPTEAAPKGSRAPGVSNANNRTATSIGNNGNRGNHNGNNNRVNIGNDVDINVDVDHDWDHGHHHHPVAAVAVTTAIVVGTRYTYMPTGCAVYPYRTLYYYCGTYYLQPVYSGTTVTYVVVVKPV